MKKLPISSLCVLKELEASLRMGIYEDRQIHTKTGFRPIKLQESRSGPHTNRTPSNNSKILILNTVIVEVQIKSNFQIVLFSLFCCLTLLFASLLAVGELNFNTFSLGRLNKQSDEISE